MDLRFWKDFTLGGVSGAIAKTLVAPLGYAKLAIQTQDADPRVRRGEVARYDGLVDCFRRVYKEQGIQAFYRGNIANCLRYFPTQLFNLYTKDIWKKLFPKYNPKTQFTQFFLANLLSGSMAAGCALAVVYPFDRVTQYRTMDLMLGKKPKGYLYYGEKMIAKRGLTSLWCGFGVSLVGIVLYRGIQLGLFDKIANLNPWKSQKDSCGTWSKFIAAQVAISVGACLTYPLDTVRRRMDFSQYFDDDDALDYAGPIDCFKKILDEEGVGGLYRGFGVNLCVSVSSALALTFYSYARYLVRH